jgi:hypothetical protein
MFPLSQLLSLTGDDLWALYDKVMRELSNAPRNTRDEIEAVAEEALHLRASLSRLTDMDEATITYFILYGISVSTTICNRRRCRMN